EREEEIKRLTEGFQSAQGEMTNMAEFKEQENSHLRQKISEQEQQIEKLVKEREAEIKKLHDGFDSAYKEMSYIADVKDKENTTLRKTLSGYEATFDNYVKLKEDEIIKLRGQLDEAKLEIDVLKVKLSAASDMQLTLDKSDTKKHYV
ncbi:MAG: hypothetical protein FWE60_02540, partial [Oscillospiraceae bacterium]|nr:hypothetical protein [Oscillospiraceae bacterium]